MNTSNTSLFFTIPQHTLDIDNLSNNDRVILGLITDRHNLSKSNNTTHDGRICLYYTRKSIATDAGLCEKTVIKSIKKLKMHGLIDETRQGQGKANIIYLVTPETLDNHKNCTFYTSRTVKNTSPELEKVQRNNNKLNNNKLNKDDDVLEKDKVTTKEESSINKENLNIFLSKYSEAMNRDFILRPSQEIAIINLINEYGMDKVLKAISHIEGNPYLMEHNDPDKFVMYFTNIYNNKYVNWGKKPEPTPAPKKKTRFNTMDSRTWDFDELDRLEREYIERKLQETKEKSHPQVKNKEERYIKQQQELIAKYNKSNYFEAYKKGEINISEYEILKSHFEKLENKIVEDITSCNTIEELEDTKVENIEIGGIELEEIEDVVGDETVKQLCFGESKKEDTVVLTEREQALVTRYRDMSAVTMAYVRKELVDSEYQFLHRYYNNKPNYKVF